MLLGLRRAYTLHHIMTAQIHLRVYMRSISLSHLNHILEVFDALFENVAHVGIIACTLLSSLEGGITHLIV